MDTSAIQSTGMSDLTTLAIVLAVSAVAVVVALAVAAALKLDRLAIVKLRGLSTPRATAALLLGIVAVGIFVGIVPGTTLLQGWGPVACIVILGSLVAASTAVSAVGAAKSVASPIAKNSSVSKAAA